MEKKDLPQEVTMDSQKKKNEEREGHLMHV